MRRAVRRLFSLPLARWGFTTLAVVSVLTAQPGPFLVTAALAAYSWHCAR
jgi:hypothetical protein